MKMNQDNLWRPSTWLVDGVEIGVQEQSPYLQNWDLKSGDHILVVRVVDLAGNATESDPVRFTVANR